MSRTERLAKLGNAIREYRGVTKNTPTGLKWSRPPKPKKVDAIIRHLEALGIAEPIPLLDDIRGFKTFDEMRAWMRRLETP